MMQHALSEQELAKFRADGVLGPFDLYDSARIGKTYRSLRAELFDRQYAAYDLPHNSRLAGYDRHLDIDFLSDHVSCEQIVHRVASILGPDIICWRSELFPKYPGDEGTDWHQADTFGHASGQPQVVWPDNALFGGALTVWTALTEATVENGCLRFIPGTHAEMFYDETKQMKYSPEEINRLEKNGIKRGFFGYDYRNLQKDPDFVPDESRAISMIMKPGQFVIFWSTLMHSSFPNSTRNSTRLGFTARYVPACVRVYPDTDQIEEYGSTLFLQKYGVVLVCGTDRYGHNRVLSSNLRGRPFIPCDR
jgi:non-haem Fe2+, alpha-ketoglutarate-dependent halogenase